MRDAVALVAAVTVGACLVALTIGWVVLHDGPYTDAEAGALAAAIAVLAGALTAAVVVARRRAPDPRPGDPPGDPTLRPHGRWIWLPEVHPDD